ncbi:Uncharacterized conserved protein YndB, AHSA1/START domain [Pedobacter terrae]|uniref:Uncharacterized conserved protein YndB, AHSA1/START domain n=1 Tax=Pedobacter terrae TaxID=405671 RepID=A0A1G7UU13_9SPHI|nr:SRPBCC domain-containing protein [Pedobacter terrae]SDG51095.1 Uncharacterized conserved protein YndB, AHSA1/START domain [Pedobacter terrae]
MNDSIEIVQVYNAPLAAVWKALTDIKLMKEWYFPQIQYFQPKIGTAFRFTDDGSAYQKEWEVTNLRNNHLIAHSWKYKGYPGNSEVTFELSVSSEGTILKLTHTGLASFPAAPQFSYHRFEQGWKMILGQNLRHCLE